MSCTIKYGVTTKSLADWGFDSARFTHSDAGEDLLVLRLSEASFAASPFAAFGEVELFDGDGVRRFRGTVISTRRSAGGPERSRTIVCAGPRVWLEGIPFGQDWEVVETPLVEGEEPVYVTKPLTIARLGRDTTPETIEAAVNAAAADGAPITLDDSDLPGDDAEAEETNVPEDMQRDLTCLGVIEKLLATHPYYGFRFEYDGGGDVTMRFYSMLRPAHGIGSLPETPFAVAELDVVTDKLESFDGEALPELLARELTLHFIEPRRFTIQAGRVKVGYHTEVTATGDGDAIRRLEHTIELRPAYWDGTEYVDAEQPKARLADQLIAPFVHLPYRVEWSEKRGSPRWDRVPGQLYNFTSAGTEFEDAHAFLHTVEHDLLTNETRCSAGLPVLLGTGQWHDLLTKLRRRNVPTAGEASGQTFGFEPDNDPPADGGAMFLIHEVNPATDVRTLKRVTLREATIAAAEAGDVTRVWSGVDEAGAYDTRLLEVIANESET